MKSWVEDISRRCKHWRARLAPEMFQRQLCPPPPDRSPPPGGQPRGGGTARTNVLVQGPELRRDDAILRAEPGLLAPAQRGLHLRRHQPCHKEKGRWQRFNYEKRCFRM